MGFILLLCFELQKYFKKLSLSLAKLCLTVLWHYFLRRLLLFQIHEHQTVILLSSESDKLFDFAKKELHRETTNILIKYELFALFQC